MRAEVRPRTSLEDLLSFWDCPLRYGMGERERRWWQVKGGTREEAVKEASWGQSHTPAWQCSQAVLH